MAIQTAAYDGTGRRIKKVVDHRGDLDATEFYYYDGWKVIEIRKGSGTNMDRQFIHGTQYIDEHVMMRAKDKGDLYIHQDANWNVIATTDLGGNLLEHYVYEPYGSLTVNQSTSWGDRDADGDVDSTDKGTVGVTCTGTVSAECRILDLDFDGDYDASDATEFDSLVQGLAKKSGRSHSSVEQAMGHQGLSLDNTIQTTQWRHRDSLPTIRRFVQRDALSSVPEQLAVPHADGLNLYGIEQCNPITRLDPLGLWSGKYNCAFASISCCRSWIFWLVLTCTRNCNLITCATEDLGDSCPATIADTISQNVASCGPPMPACTTFSNPFQCTQSATGGIHCAGNWP